MKDRAYEWNYFAIPSDSFMLLCLFYETVVLLAVEYALNLDVVES